MRPDGTQILDWWDEGKEKIKEIAQNVSKKQSEIRQQLENVIRQEYQEAISKFDKDPNLTNAKKVKDANRDLDRWEKTTY